MKRTSLDKLEVDQLVKKVVEKAEKSPEKVGKILTEMIHRPKSYKTSKKNKVA